jgi:hypothetical protein
VQDFQQNVSSLLSCKMVMDPEEDGRMSPTGFKAPEERLGSEMKTERVLLSNIQSQEERLAGLKIQELEGQVSELKE